MMLFLLACTQSEKTSGQDTSTVVESGPDFENEEHLRVYELQEDTQFNYLLTAVGKMAEGYFVNLTPPTYPYEVQSVTYQLLNYPDGGCGTGDTLNLIAHASNVPPSENSGIVEFMQYDSLSPYIFPSLENTESAVVLLDSSSNSEAIVENVFEFTAVFDTPLLIEEDLDLWIGFGIHDIPPDEFTCSVHVQTNGLSSYRVEDGQMEFDGEYSVNLGVNVRY